MAEQSPTSWLQNLAIAIEIFSPGLTLVVTGLRFYTRLTTKTFGSDDVCIGIAMGLTIALAAGSIICIKKLYVGIHSYNIPPSTDLSSGLIWTYVVGAIYNPIVSIVKQSVLAFTLRFVEPGTRAGVRAAVVATAAFNLALMVATFVCCIFQCTPVRYYWDDTVTGGYCINQSAFAISTAVLTIVTDLVTLGLPCYVFMTLQMKRKRKVGLVGIFLLGFVATIVAVIRLYFIASELTTTTTTAPQDSSFSVAFCVSTIECSVAIIAASAPALVSLVRMRWKPLEESGNRTRTTPSQGAHAYRSHPNTDDGAWINLTEVFQSAQASRDVGGRSFQLDALSAPHNTTGVDAGGQTRAGLQVGDSDEEGLIMSPGGICKGTEVIVMSNIKPFCRE